MWAARLLLLLGVAQLALAVDGSRDAFRQRVCMVSEVGSAADSGAARVWWWVRFLLQELLDWATSLTASAAAIAACAVLLRRTDPQPAPRPRVVNFLAEALQGGKSWATIPRRLQFGFVTTTPDRRPSRGVQTISRSTLDDGASSNETVSLGVQASSEESAEDTQVQEETASLKEKTSLVELQKKASLEDLQEKPPLEAPQEKVSLEVLQEKASLEVQHNKPSLEVLQEEVPLEVLHEKASLDMRHEKPFLQVLHEKPSLEALHEKPTLEVLHEEPSMELLHEKHSLGVLHEKPSLEVLHERKSLEVLHERTRLEVVQEKPSMEERATLEVLHERARLEVVQEKPSMEERATLEEKASLEKNMAEENPPEATARSSRVSRDSGAQETRENLSQTSEGCLTLYRTPPEGQESPTHSIGPSEQLVATLTKYLDAVVTELRVTNSRLACVLPNLETTVKQPKQSPEAVVAVSRTASKKSSRTSSGTLAAREMVEAASSKRLSPPETASSKRLSPPSSVPSERGDSDAALTATEGSDDQAPASWLQAQQQQLAQERRVYERRVIALERRLREVLSELQVTRCQLADALTQQDFRGRQVPRIEMRSESSVSLVSSTMDAMLSTASVGSDDSESETRSSASVSPKSTCTVVYRTKRRTAVQSSVSSGSVAASDSFTSACTMVEDAVKTLTQDKTRSSPALSRSLLDITDAKQSQSRAKAQMRRPASEATSESSFVSSVSESEPRDRDKKETATNSWTEISGNWLRAVQQLVQQLRSTPQQSQSSDETTPTPESAPRSSEERGDTSYKQSTAVIKSTEQQPEPGDTSYKHSAAVIKSTEQQPVSTSSSSEVSSAEARTSTRSLLSRMVNALMSTSSGTGTSVVDTRAPVEVSNAPSVDGLPSRTVSRHIEDKDVTPGPASDHTISVPPTEANAPGTSLLSRMMNAILPSSTAAPAPLPQPRSGQPSRTVSDAAISSPARIESTSPARIESTLSASSVVSRVSCMLGLSVERSEPAVPEEPPPPPRHWLLQVADRWLTTSCSPPQPPVS